MRRHARWPGCTLVLSYLLTGGTAHASEAPEAILSQAPPPTGTFRALDDSNGYWPPNTQGAVGANHLMVTLGTQVRVQMKTNGSPVGTLMSLNAFWTSVSGVSGAEEPRVVYDPLASRFITVATDDRANTSTGGVLVGVSKTSDPTVHVPTTDTWYFFKINTAPYWPVRPRVGFNKNWVVVQADLHDASGFVESRVYAIDRAPFFGGALSYRMRIFPGGPGVVPAAQYGDAIDPLIQPDELYLLQTSSPTSGQLALYKLVGPGSENVLPVGVVSDTPAVPWSDGVGWADFAPQRSSTGSCQCTAGPCPPRWIYAGDSRIQSVVYRNGHIWAAQTVFLPAVAPTRASIQWWKVDLSGNVAQRGLVDDATGARFFAYPSLAVNQNDDVLLGYSRFQADEFAGASYSFRTAIDPPGSMQSERPFKDGEACYFKDPTSSGANQWGAYSAAAVDPADDKTLWTVQEYAAPSANTTSTGDRWGTWWGMLDPTPKIAITDATVAEAPSPGTTRLVFDVSLLTSDLSQPLPTSQPVTVQWSTADVTTTAGADYDAVINGTVTFAPGETTKTIQVTVHGDALPEGPETLVVNLFAPFNATLSDNQAVGTILDLPPPQISIGDVTQVEGASGTTSFVFPVTLSYPSSTVVTVDWTTQDGAATAPGDYGTDSGTVTFSFPTVVQMVTIQVNGDTTIEGDEDFSVELTTHSANATVLKTRGVGWIQDDDTVHPGVAALSILADSDAASGNTGRNRLQWVNPPGAESANRILINFTEGGSCFSPSTTGAGTAIVIPAPIAVGKAVYSHENLVLGQQYCYSVWLDYGASQYSQPASLKARPFDSTGSVKWKLSTGASLMPAPTVGLEAVIAVSNDMRVQALERDPASGGLWPGPWTPRGLGALVHHRVPVVPFGGVSRAYIATENGWIHAVKTENGALMWSTHLPEGEARGAPAFIAGGYDYVLVGTSRLNDNHFYALHPDTGAVIDVFPTPADGVSGVGPILGMATVDYTRGSVYFASWQGGAGKSLWCLDLGPTSDALRLRWSRDIGPGHHVTGSPVLRGGRVYVGDDSREVWSIPAATGQGGYSRTVGTSPIKGFVFPDRNSGDLYGATDNEVVGLIDDGSSLLPKWAPIPLDAPSIVLFVRGTPDLYAGVQADAPNGASLVRIDTDIGQVAGRVALEAGPLTVGAPSLDLGYGQGVIHVGSALGILYAVQLPF